MGMVITIDGPAASGKSSVSRELARRLGWQWVSTGAFYRGLAYAALQMDIDLDDVKGLADLTHNPVWSVKMEQDRTRVYFKEQDVTDQIAHEDVGNFASKVSHYPDVRKALLDAQRNCSNGPQGLVAEGRDCGTVVFPKAEAKVYLTANSEHRAARRAAELGLDQGDMVKAQQQRDLQDSTRKVAPMAVPEDALVVDTTALNLDQVVDEVVKYVKNKI
ncbi:cytidylate kinase [Bdellovibrio bacteriovorus]|uniref:Cytidylate kinase n=1 Tax=Bdellovibrio bacteriovorus TaxID=959 RepID=A0A150WEL3_BDEBC|nr:(d)CMP kinase [Bdellovibrio bacteriovorus]KYG61537.1 cytidylate kinase [Bdellovibrio bacteriovorus]